MEQNIENKIETKDRINNFYNNNKGKIYISIAIVIIASLAFFYFKQNNEKKNILIAEKYVEAELLMSSEQQEKAKNIYVEIIQSNNSFYSILSLNEIIEKNLIQDKNKILNYFEILEKSVTSKDSKDLIFLKKALYLIKISNKDEGNIILKNLVEKNSKLKSIAQELIEE